ncbi:MAG TPA: ABC transporter permease [Blastocatellia bacterium]|nr:ABC transporter permease [Blastocatellia bacterium]
MSKTDGGLIADRPRALMSEPLAGGEGEAALPGVLGDAKTRRHDESARAERLHPLVQLTLARLREFIREREAVFWVFVFPVLLAFALGIAFRNTAPEITPVAIEDGTVVRAPAVTLSAADLAQSLSQTDGLHATVMAPEQAAKALRTGKVALVIRPGRNAQPRVGDATATFDYRYDPTRPESRMARLAVDDAVQRAMGRADVARAGDETVSEPGARYIDYLIPGLIGLNLMGSGMWGLGFAVVQARTRKLLKRFAATPMRRSHYLLSFMLSRLVFLFLEVAAVIGFAWGVFSVSVHGSLIDLVVISLLGAMTFAGLGLLVASRPKTIEGVSGWMNLVMLPMWLLSGTFFSASRFPEFLQPFIKALPLTALNDSLRAVMSEGAPLAVSWLEISILVAWGVASFALALRLFRWQ